MAMLVITRGYHIPLKQLFAGFNILRHARPGGGSFFPSGHPKETQSLKSLNTIGCPWKWCRLPKCPKLRTPASGLRTTLFLIVLGKPNSLISLSCFLVLLPQSATYLFVFLQHADQNHWPRNVFHRMGCRDPGEKPAELVATWVGSCHGCECFQPPKMPRKIGDRPPKKIPITSNTIQCTG